MSSAPSRNSSDPVGIAIDAAADVVGRAVVDVQADKPVVIIDGRSGSGKTSLARTLVNRWPLQGRVQLVALDWLYPGWDGLAEGVESARARVLSPHVRGVEGVWQRWDWVIGAYAKAHTVDPSLALIVEGSGALTKATAALGDVRIWLESPESSRRGRALARDGETYRPHWERWAEQEQRHLTNDEPERWATHSFMIP